MIPLRKIANRRNCFYGKSQSCIVTFVCSLFSIKPTSLVFLIYSVGLNMKSSKNVWVLKWSNSTTFNGTELYKFLCEFVGV